MLILFSEGHSLDVKEQHSMNVWDAIKQRNSIRVFKTDPVPRQLLEKVLRAGVEAPSSANMQPWEFVVVGGDDKDQ